MKKIIFIALMLVSFAGQAQYSIRTSEETGIWDVIWTLLLIIFGIIVTVSLSNINHKLQGLVNSSKRDIEIQKKIGVPKIKPPEEPWKCHNCKQNNIINPSICEKCGTIKK